MCAEAAHRGLSGGKGGGEVPLRFPPLRYGMLRDRYGVLRDFLLPPFPRTPNPPSLAHLHLLRTCGALQVRSR